MLIHSFPCGGRLGRGSMKRNNKPDLSSKLKIGMILIRYLLICIIGYLVVRSFVKFGEEKSSVEKHEQAKKDKVPQKKVSKEIGEYVDYEEVKK